MGIAITVRDPLSQEYYWLLSLLEHCKRSEFPELFIQSPHYNLCVSGDYLAVNETDSLFCLLTDIQLALKGSMNEHHSSYGVSVINYSTNVFHVNGKAKLHGGGNFFWGGVYCTPTDFLVLGKVPGTY